MNISFEKQKNEEYEIKFISGCFRFRALERISLLYEKNDIQALT